MANKGLIISGTIGALIAANVIGAKIIGNNLEESIKSSVAAYSEQLRIKMEVANFETSWFSSKFQIKVSMPTPFTEYLRENFGTEFKINIDETYGQIIFDQSIVHGPIAFTQNGPRIGLAFWHSDTSLTDDFLDKRLANDKMTADKKEELKNLWPQFKTLSRIELDGSSSLFGTISNNIHINGGSLNLKTDNKNIDLTINPFELEWTLNNSYDASDIIFTWKGMNLKVPNEVNFTINEFSGTTEIERVKPKIWLGKSTAHIGSFHGEGPDDTQYNFSGIDMTSSVNVDLEDDSFSVNVFYNSKEFNLKSPKVNMDFDGFKLDASVSKIPFPLLEILLEFTDQIQQVTSQELSDQSSIFLEQLMSFDYHGNIIVDLNMKNMLIELKQDKKALIDFHPLNISYNLDNENKESDFKFDWQGIKMDIDKMVNMSIDTITSNIHQYQVNPQLWLGNSDFHLSKFKINDNKTLNVAIDKLDFEGTLSPSDDNVNAQTTLNYLFENVNIESPFGNVKINNHRSEWNIENIPLELFEFYQDYSNPFQLEKIKNPALSNEKAAEKLATITMQPTINMNNFDLTLDTGTLKSKATINFNEPFSLNDQNLKELLDLSANVGLSEAFVNDIMKITSQRNPQMATMTSEQRIQMVKTQLTQLIQQGLLIEQKDDYYTADIGTKNNFITINGKPIFPLITPPAP